MKMTDSEIYTRYMYSYPHKTAYRKIDPVDISDYKKIFNGASNHLYIHIPFCGTRCGYCNLFSVTGKSADYLERYTDALEKHAHQLKEMGLVFDSLTIGGGTPLILSAEQLGGLFYTASRVLNIDLQKTFICTETSPNETDKKKTAILKENHVNRVSIGIQSFLEKELKILNRSHTAANAEAALCLLKDAGFPSINIDLIYGIPSQTAETLRYSLERTVYYSPEEIFLYPLYTRRTSSLKSFAFPEKYPLYLFAKDYLLEHGYKQISMRRFTKDMEYSPSGCGFENTISLGAGGRSFIGNLHSCLPYSVRQDKCLRIIDEYMASNNKLKIDYGYILNENEQKRRHVLKNLFVVNGLSIAEYKKSFKSNIYEDFDFLHAFIEQGYYYIADDRLILTDLGLSLSDYLGPMFISEEVKTKMEEWDCYDY